MIRTKNETVNQLVTKKKKEHSDYFDMWCQTNLIYQREITLCLFVGSFLTKHTEKIVIKCVGFSF